MEMSDDKKTLFESSGNMDALVDVAMAIKMGK